jgi:hypothetical protein
MPKVNVYLQHFAVGVQDKKHLPRVDLERMRLAAETQTNLLPLTSGRLHAARSGISLDHG